MDKILHHLRNHGMIIPPANKVTRDHGNFSVNSKLCAGPPWRGREDADAMGGVELAAEAQRSGGRSGIDPLVSYIPIVARVCLALLVVAPCACKFMFVCFVLFVCFCVRGSDVLPV